MDSFSSYRSALVGTKSEKDDVSDWKCTPLDVEKIENNKILGRKRAIREKKLERDVQKKIPIQVPQAEEKMDVLCEEDNSEDWFDLEETTTNGGDQLKGVASHQSDPKMVVEEESIRVVHSARGWIPRLKSDQDAREEADPSSKRGRSYIKGASSSFTRYPNTMESKKKIARKIAKEKLLEKRQMAEFVERRIDNLTNLKEKLRNLAYDCECPPKNEIGKKKKFVNRLNNILGYDVTEKIADEMGLKPFTDKIHMEAMETCLADIAKRLLQTKREKIDEQDDVKDSHRECPEDLSKYLPQENTKHRKREEEHKQKIIYRVSSEKEELLKQIHSTTGDTGVTKTRSGFERVSPSREKKHTIIKKDFVEEEESKEFKSIFESELHDMYDNWDTIVNSECKTPAAPKKFKHETSLISQPDHICFYDFFPGHVYQHKISLLNTSTSWLFCRLLRITTQPEDAESLFEVSLNDTKKVAPGLSVNVTVTFSPLEDTAGSVDANIEYLTRRHDGELRTFSTKVTCAVTSPRPCIINCVIRIPKIKWWNKASITRQVHILNNGSVPCYAKIMSLYDETKPESFTVSEVFKSSEKYMNHSKEVKLFVKDLVLDAMSMAVEPVQFKTRYNIPLPGRCRQDIPFDINVSQIKEGPYSYKYKIVFEGEAIIKPIEQFFRIEGEVEPCPIVIDPTFIDFGICTVESLSQVPFKIQNKSKMPFPLCVSIPAILSQHVQVYPSNPVLNPNSSLDVIVRIIPRFNICREATGYLNPDTSLLSFFVNVTPFVYECPFVKPFKVEVNAKLDFPVLLTFNKYFIDLGVVSIYDTVRTVICMGNRGQLPRKYGFFKTPSFVSIQPNFGFGVINSGEVIELEILYSPTRVEVPTIGSHKVHYFNLVCTTSAVMSIYPSLPTFTNFNAQRKSNYSTFAAGSRIQQRALSLSTKDLVSSKDILMTKHTLVFDNTSLSDFDCLSRSESICASKTTISNFSDFETPRFVPITGHNTHVKKSSHRVPVSDEEQNEEINQEFWTKEISVKSICRGFNESDVVLELRAFVICPHYELSAQLIHMPPTPCNSYSIANIFLRPNQIIDRVCECKTDIRHTRVRYEIFSSKKCLVIEPKTGEFEFGKEIKLYLIFKHSLTEHQIHDHARELRLNYLRELKLAEIERKRLEKEALSSPQKRKRHSSDSSESKSGKSKTKKIWKNWKERDRHDKRRVSRRKHSRTGSTRADSQKTRKKKIHLTSGDGKDKKEREKRRTRGNNRDDSSGEDFDQHEKRNRKKTPVKSKKGKTHETNKKEKVSGKSRKETKSKGREKETTGERKVGKRLLPQLRKEKNNIKGEDVQKGDEALNAAENYKETPRNLPTLDSDINLINNETPRNLPTLDNNIYLIDNETPRNLHTLDNNIHLIHSGKGRETGTGKERETGLKQSRRCTPAAKRSPDHPAIPPERWRELQKYCQSVRESNKIKEQTASFKENLNLTQGQGIIGGIEPSDIIGKSGVPRGSSKNSRSTESSSDSDCVWELTPGVTKMIKSTLRTESGIKRSRKPGSNKNSKMSRKKKTKDSHRPERGNTAHTATKKNLPRKKIDLNDLIDAKIDLLKNMKPHGLVVDAKCLISLRSSLDLKNRTEELLSLKVLCPIIKPNIVVITPYDDPEINFGPVAIGSKLINIIKIYNISGKIIQVYTTLLNPVGPFFAPKGLPTKIDNLKLELPESFDPKKGMILQPEQTIEYPIIFTPKAPQGFANEYFEVISDSTVVFLQVRGKGVTPHVKCTPDFTICRMRTSKTGYVRHTITMTNITEAPLSLHFKVAFIKEGYLTEEQMNFKTSRKPSGKSKGNQKEVDFSKTVDVNLLTTIEDEFKPVLDHPFLFQVTQDIHLKPRKKDTVVILFNPNSKKTMPSREKKSGYSSEKKEDEIHKKDNAGHKKDIEGLKEDNEGHNKESEGHKKDKRGHKKDNRGHKKDNRRQKKDNEEHKKDNEEHKKDSEEHQKDSEEHKKDGEEHKKDYDGHKKDNEGHKKENEGHKEIPTTQGGKISPSSTYVAKIEIFIDGLTHFKDWLLIGSINKKIEKKKKKKT